MKTKMKAFLCILLCVSMLLPAVIAASANGENVLQVLVASDTHYRPQNMLGPIGGQTGLPGDPLYWHTNIQGQLTYESDAIMNELLARFAASSSRFLLLAGDITDDGYLGEHLALAEKFRQFEARTGKSIFIINGNHDINVPGTAGKIDLAQFKSIYAGFGYDEALSRDNATASYTAELDAGYRLIAIDTSAYSRDTSEITPDLFAWIEAQVKQAQKDGKKLIAIEHYSVLEHFKNQGTLGKNLMVPNYKEFASQLADWGIKYVFTGHVHANDISSAVSEMGNKIYDIETGALVSYPNAYRCVTFSNDAVKVESRCIDKINEADLPEGYTSAQLALISSDFHAYSLGYFKAGMNRYINEYIGTPRKVASALKIPNNSAAYSALALVMSELGKALNLPIYDINGTPAIDSVEEIAAAAGAGIEPSSYKKLPEVVGTVMAANYTGDENIPFDSAEIRIFMDCFKAALTYALVNIPVSSANALLTALGLPGDGFTVNNGLVTQAAKLIYMQTAAEKIFNVVLEPLLGSFTQDSFAPGDINETLEAYGTSGGTAGNFDPVSGSQTAADWLFRLLNLLKNLFKAIINI